jgi:hypothetical protein
MSTLTIQQAFMVNGQAFATKAEAMSFIRRPLILAAMLDATGNQESLANWLTENQETVESAFESSNIRRVTKSDYVKLDKALEAIKDSANPAFAFITDNLLAVRESFRWPAVKRMTPEEKAAEATTVLFNASENKELASWVVENQSAVLEAYNAGVEKREVSEKAVQGLAQYQADKRAREDAEAEAQGPEAVAALEAKREANRLKREAKVGK